MSAQIKKVGVIGAGLMGAAIAAHTANVGLETVLLDILPPQMPDALAEKGIGQDSREYRDYLASQGLQGALKSKPASFFIPEDAELITIGNLEDDLDLLADSDWVVEVVVEILEVKKDLLAKLVEVVKEDAIVTTNTSGISVAAMSSHLPEGFQERFMGTHFFNPPRYMKLFEIIPGPKTRPDVLEAMAGFAEKVLGKGVVFANDTPNFIANRIGIFQGSNTNRLMVEAGFSLEEVDALTGPVLGRPKTASFRLADLVGLDVSKHVAANLRENCPEDERLEVFTPLDWQTKMLEKGWLGNKTKGGYYKKSKNTSGKLEFLVFDWKTLEYRSQREVKFASLSAAKQAGGLKNKLKTLYFAEDAAGRFTFKHISEVLIYAANRIPEISEDIVNIDNAFKWGFNWKLGIFETWDALGLARSATAMREAGYTLPSWVEEMLDNGFESFYQTQKGQTFYYDITARDYKALEISPQIIFLPSLKDREKTVAQNSGASLIDLGDGVACLEFHSKMNSLGGDILSMVAKTADQHLDGFDGLVIANHGTNFSVGANIMMILFAAQEEEWDDLEFSIKQFQDAFLKLKHSPKPVVAAPHQMALGGGFEVCLAADKVVAGAETYMGLVEVGVGVIPAGGGCKELLVRNTVEKTITVAKGGIYPRQIYLLPFVARAFETIAMAKVSTSAKEAVKLGLLRDSDIVVMNADYRIKRAKDTVLALNMMGYQPQRPLQKIRVLGKDSLATFQYVIYNMKKAGMITEHDVVVATELARVMTGGNVLPDTEVSEQYLLDLEREVFVRLCGTKGTQARLMHMLKTGKTLRN